MTVRIRKPLTPEQAARKATVNREWRQRKKAHLARYARKNAEHANRRRRTSYASNPANAEAQREKNRLWKLAHPDHNAEFYRTHRGDFTGTGKWASHARKTGAAWRKFTSGNAAIRARVAATVPRGTNNPGESA